MDRFNYHVCNKYYVTCCKWMQIRCHFSSFKHRIMSDKKNFKDSFNIYRCFADTEHYFRDPLLDTDADSLVLFLSRRTYYETN